MTSASKCTPSSPRTFTRAPGRPASINAWKGVVGPQGSETDPEPPFDGGDDKMRICNGNGNPVSQKWTSRVKRPNPDPRGRLNVRTPPPSDFPLLYFGIILCIVV